MRVPPRGEKCVFAPKFLVHHMETKGSETSEKMIPHKNNPPPFHYCCRVQGKLGKHTKFVTFFVSRSSKFPPFFQTWSLVNIGNVGMRMLIMSFRSEKQNAMQAVSIVTLTAAGCSFPGPCTFTLVRGSIHVAFTIVLTGTRNAFVFI